MKKKHIAAILLSVGAVLIFLAILLALIETGNKDIIGGAGWSTFSFVFLHGMCGMYFALGCTGGILLFTGVILYAAKNKN